MLRVIARENHADLKDEGFSNRLKFSQDVGLDVLFLNPFQFGKIFYLGKVRGGGQYLAFRGAFLV